LHKKYTANLIHATGGGRRINGLDDVQLSQSDGFAWYPDEFAYLVTFFKEFLMIPIHNL
jgi:hypothetical protein